MSPDLIDLYYLLYKHLGFYSTYFYHTQEFHGIIIGRINYALTSVRALELTRSI